MALYKRDDSKFWWLKLKFKGRRYQFSTKCRNKRDAETFEAAFRTKLASGEIDLKKKDPAPTIDIAVADFLEWSSVHNGESTHKSYVTRSEAILRYFGDISVNEIDRDAIGDFVKWRIKQKKKAPTRKLKKE